MNSDKPWKRIKERAGLDGIHMHDLRRTFGTWPAPGGDTTQQIGKLMGHKSHITAKVYAEIAGGKTELVEQMSNLITGAAARPRMPITR